MRIVVGVSGASGAIYGLRLLEKLRAHEDVEIHLILSRAGEKTLYLETGKPAAELKALAHHTHPVENIGSPCSVHTMSAIATGITDNLLTRAADVTLKERRKLILMVRESPLHLGHLRSMAALAEMGAILAPPAPAFYLGPQTVLDLVDQSVDRILDLLGLAAPDAQRWLGPKEK